MRYDIFIAFFLLVTTGIVVSCKKYQDPKATNDPRLTNPYCNEPKAVNYNLGFPGRPDKTVCIYPTDLFTGNYFFRDSVFKTADNLFLLADSFPINITRASDTVINVIGFCPSGAILKLTAGPTYIATVDTTVGDTSVLNWGQIFCRTQDTVTGTITRDRVDTLLLHVVLQIASDTGMTTHIGEARKQ
jgi:hypothetical protein